MKLESFERAAMLIIPSSLQTIDECIHLTLGIQIYLINVQEFSPDCVVNYPEWSQWKDYESSYDPSSDDGTSMAKAASPIGGVDEHNCNKLSDKAPWVMEVDIGPGDEERICGPSTSANEYKSMPAQERKALLARQNAMEFSSNTNHEATNPVFTTLDSISSTWHVDNPKVCSLHLEVRPCSSATQSVNHNPSQIATRTDIEPLSQWFNRSLISRVTCSPI